MRRDGWKWALAGGAIALLIVYGLDSVDGGIENVYGPVGEGAQTHAVNDIYTQEQSTRPDSSNHGVWEANNGEASSLSRAERQERQEDSPSDPQRYAAAERLPGVPYDTSEPAVNKLADGTAGVLQSVSRGGIKLFVSVFDGIMD